MPPAQKPMSRNGRESTCPQHPNNRRKIAVVCRLRCAGGMRHGDGKSWLAEFLKRCDPFHTDWRRRRAMGQESPEPDQQRKWNQKFDGCGEPNPVADLGPIR